MIILVRVELFASESDSGGKPRPPGKSKKPKQEDVFLLSQLQRDVGASRGGSLDLSLTSLYPRGRWWTSSLRASRWRCARRTLLQEPLTWFCSTGPVLNPSAAFGCFQVVKQTLICSLKPGEAPRWVPAPQAAFWDATLPGTWWVLLAVARDGRRRFVTCLSLFVGGGQSETRETRRWRCGEADGTASHSSRTGFKWRPPPPPPSPTGAWNLRRVSIRRPRPLRLFFTVL